MEYVRGEAITTYCNRHRLSTKQRIDLFLEVCDRVQHAHQKGIIHRDLKPSNILVTFQDDHPVPKIIDFGVAKATTQHLTERTLYTEGESHPETLQSMHNLATTYEALQRYADAESLYSKTIELRRQVLGDEHPELANTRFTLARMYFVQRQYREPEQLAMAAYGPMFRSVGANHDRTLRIVKLLADLYDASGKSEKAAEWRAKLPKEAAAKTAAR